MAQQGPLLYEGKAKSVYLTDTPDQLILHFKDDTSAFDGLKVEKLAGKGALNNQFNGFVMEKLAVAGVANHFIQLLSPTDSLVKKLDMIPVECVVRNIAAGSLCKRLGVKEGLELSPPTFEFFLKNDALHDPMINESHIRAFGWATEPEMAAMKALTLKANAVLKEFFAEAGVVLVDYKLEFGRYGNEVLLGDEFSPDGCRLWDAKTREKLDKDRFRQSLGGVLEAYKKVGEKVGVVFEGN